MMVFLVVLHVVFCLTLILVILLQAGRGQGLSGPSFSSGNVQSLFGTRAGDFLTKATSVAAICFLFTCLGLNWLEAQKSRSLMQGTRRTAPVGLDDVQKLLEKVKQEAPEAAKDAAGTAATAVDAPVETAPAGAPAAEVPAKALEEAVAAANPADGEKGK